MKNTFSKILTIIIKCWTSKMSQWWQLFTWIALGKLSQALFLRNDIKPDNNTEIIFTNHVRSTREGNVFSRICDSVHKGVVGQKPPHLKSPLPRLHRPPDPNPAPTMTHLIWPWPPSGQWAPGPTPLSARTTLAWSPSPGWSVRKSEEWGRGLWSVHLLLKGFLVCIGEMCDGPI